MQLDPVKACRHSPLGRIGKQSRQDLRQFCDMGQMHIGDPLAIAHGQGFPFSSGQNLLQLLGGQGSQGLTHRAFIRLLQAKGLTMTRSDHEKTGKKLLGLRAAANAEKIDQLNEEAGAPATFRPHGLCQALQAGNETVVADAQQGAGGNITDARGLDHNGAGTASGEAAIPVDIGLGDITIVRRPPWDHGRHPGAALKL